MHISATDLPEVLIIEPDVHRDPRGFFLESYHAAKFGAAGITDTFVQDNHSRSLRGTLRGLHAQHKKPQAKLVRAVEGRIWDVAVDIRRGSPRFGRWVAVELSAENFRQCYVPPGFAHGFCVLSDVAQVVYKVTDFYDPADELGIRWDDPEIGIAWPLRDPILSPKDRDLPLLAELIDQLPA